jgi:hypothetical protein
MGDRVFLTDAREQVLEGTYDGSNSALRNQKSRLRSSASIALAELRKVAASEEIENEDIFDPEMVYKLLLALFSHNQGLLRVGLDTDHQRQMYIATERAQLQVERDSDRSGIYTAYGGKVEELHNDEGTDE